MTQNGGVFAHVVHTHTRTPQLRACTDLECGSYDPGPIVCAHGYNYQLANYAANQVSDCEHYGHRLQAGQAKRVFIANPWRWVSGQNDFPPLMTDSTLTYMYMYMYCISMLSYL